MRVIYDLIKISFLTLLMMTIITGLFYPALITGLGTWWFDRQSHGDLSEHGAYFIGQNFSQPCYFWSRPSATSPFPYNAASSSGSNLGPRNPELIKEVTARVKRLHSYDPANKKLIPIDLVTTSASGLDPDISPAAADYQVSRVAHYRNLPLALVHKLVEEHITPRQLGFLGEPRVNVVQLNLALDRITQSHAGSRCQMIGKAQANS